MHDVNLCVWGSPGAHGVAHVGGVCLPCHVGGVSRSLKAMKQPCIGLQAAWYFLEMLYKLVSIQVDLGE